MENLDKFPESPTTIEATCAKCQNLLVLPYPPTPIMNHPTVSIIAVPHTVGIQCRCGTYYNLAVVQAGLDIRMVEMPKPVVNEEKLVVPSTILPFKTH